MISRTDGYTGNTDSVLSVNALSSLLRVSEALLSKTWPCRIDSDAGWWLAALLACGLATSYNCRWSWAVQTCCLSLQYFSIDRKAFLRVWLHAFYGRCCQAWMASGVGTCYGRHWITCLRLRNKKCCFVPVHCTVSILKLQIQDLSRNIELSSPWPHCVAHSADSPFLVQRLAVIWSCTLLHVAWYRLTSVIARRCA